MLLMNALELTEGLSALSISIDGVHISSGPNAVDYVLAVRGCQWRGEDGMSN